MSSSNSLSPTTLTALKGLSILTPFVLAGSMSSASLELVPSLIALTRRSAEIDTPSSSRSNNGRLTPQPTPLKESSGFTLTVPSSSTTSKASNTGYETAAQQFTSITRSATKARLAPGVLSLLSSTILAYHYQTSPSSRGRNYLTVAALIAAIVPLTSAFMAPIEHKIARIAGAEEKIEPYEDSPPARDQESANTQLFLERWDGWNKIRTAVVLLAGGIGLWTEIGPI